jgi:hypothetical protein
LTAVVVLPTHPLLLTTATITGNFSVILSRTARPTSQIVQCQYRPKRADRAAPDTVDEQQQNSAASGRG